MTSHKKGSRVVVFVGSSFDLAHPTVGEFYERFVKSVKTPLKKTLGKAILTEEEMRKTLK